MKKKQLRQAVRDFNDWQGHAIIMFDTEDDDVWCDIFTNDTTYKKYHSNTIHAVIVKDNFLGRDDTTTINDVIEGIKYMYKPDLIIE